MHSVLVISKNKKSISYLRGKLTANKIFEQPECTDSFVAAKALLKKTNYQLVVIELEDNSPEIIKLLDSSATKDINLIIIHNNSAFHNKLFNLNLSGFIDISSLDTEFNLALKRVQKKIISKVEHNNRFNNLIKIVSQNQHSKISLPLDDGLEIVDSNDIIFIRASKNSSEICLVDGRILSINKNINEFEKLTIDLSFLRIHRSYIINLMHVKQYLKKNGGSIEMSNQTNLPISSSKKSDFNKKIQKASLFLS